MLILDLDKFEKIFNNLFKNALQYSPKSSEVDVHFTYAKGHLITIIQDQGPGISKEELPHVFDKYFRSNHKQSKVIEGSGLGLAIVKELVDLLQGELFIESQNGTKFTYSIPARIATTPVPEITETIENITEQNQINIFDNSDSHILIVEDNEEMLRYLEMVLSTTNKITTANNPLIALQLLQEHSYDLIVSDIMMPGMDGITFKKRVDMIFNSGQSTPFIFLSAKALDEEKLEGLNLGVDDYITKPFSTEELKVRIKNLLQRNSIRLNETSVDNDSDTIKAQDGQDNFVAQASYIVLNKIQNPNFGVQELADGMHYSTVQLNRRLKKQTGLTSVQFILEIRLQRARRLLLSNEYYSSKEIQHQVGILSQSYFSKKYSERFGAPPGQVSKSNE